MSSAIRPAPQFQVGDWVSFLYGPKTVVAQVIEDRGLLGVRGRRLYRVRLDLDQSEPYTIELPEEDLKAAEAPSEANPLLTATLDYLSRGKRFTRISPEKITRSKRRRITFHFSDGTEEERSFEADHATFMGWWEETSAYLRRMADAFENPSGRAALVGQPPVPPGRLPTTGLPGRPGPGMIGTGSATSRPGAGAPGRTDARPTMAGIFELKKATDGQFHFNLKAGNGEVILSSERYTAKAMAEKGIDSVRRNAPLADRFRRLTSTAGEPYFVLAAANGEVIGVSEMYTSADGMENGIASVMRNAPDAKLKDLTAPEPEP